MFDVYLPYVKDIQPSKKTHQLFNKFRFLSLLKL